jgi:hypothetical protein
MRDLPFGYPEKSTGKKGFNSVTIIPTLLARQTNKQKIK